MRILLIIFISICCVVIINSNSSADEHGQYCWDKHIMTIPGGGRYVGKWKDGELVKEE